MEDGFKTKLPTVMFRGTPCTSLERFTCHMNPKKYLHNITFSVQLPYICQSLPLRDFTEIIIK